MIRQIAALLMALAATHAALGQAQAPLRAHASPDAFIAGMTEDTALLDSLEPGPILFVVAGIHGDEPSGPAALALTFLGGGRTGLGRGFGLVPEMGILAGITAASKEAVRKGSRVSGTGLDMNSLFPGSGGAASAASAGSAGSARSAAGVESRRAAAIFATARNADLTLDLHEENFAWREADRPTLVSNPHSAGIARAMLERLSREGLEFAHVEGAPEGSLAAALGNIGKPGISVEVPARLPLAEKTALQASAIRAAMLALGMLK